MKCIISSKKSIDDEPFNVKVIANNRIKINLKSGDTNRKVKKIEEKKFLWHSYENKQERCFGQSFGQSFGRVMAKKLHYSTDTEAIK